MPTISDYITRLPKEIPAGKVLVHNHVKPRVRIGSNGFRAWIEPPSDEHEVCPCKWASNLGTHYRMAANYK